MKKKSTNVLVVKQCKSVSKDIYGIRGVNQKANIRRGAPYDFPKRVEENSLNGQFTASCSEIQI